MRTILIGVLLLATSSLASAQDRVYEGTWVTTNRALEGSMNCAVTEKGKDNWQGHFYGVWYGQEFSYTVTFNGPPTRLRGRAIVDGAEYEWTGEMTGETFRGRFGGDRYEGSFTLKRKGR